MARWVVSIRILLSVVAGGAIAAILLHTRRAEPVTEAIEQTPTTIRPTAPSPIESPMSTTPALPETVSSAEPAPAPPRTAQLLQQQILNLLANSLDNPTRETALANLIAQLLAADPSAAARLVDTQPPGAARAELLRLLAQAWAAADFPQAIHWASTLRDSAERRIAFEYAVFKAAEIQPIEAIDAWTAFEPAPEHAVLGNLVQQWAYRDLPAALKWASERPPPEARNHALSHVVFVLSQSDPARAAEIVSRQMTPSAPQIEATVALARTWAARNLPAATAWVETHLQGSLAERARQELTAFASP